MKNYHLLAAVTAIIFGFSVLASLATIFLWAFSEKRVSEGYPLACIVMAIVSGALLSYFTNHINPPNNGIR